MTSSNSIRRHLAGVAMAVLACAAGKEARAQTIPAPPTAVRIYAGSATVPTAAVTVSPATATVQAGATVQFSAAVTGTSNNSVVWSATGGTITPGGTYTAGSASGTYAVKATLSGGTLTGSASVTVQGGDTYVDIRPGEDIQARVAGMPAGTKFRLKAGLHRLATPITPKDGNAFVGESGTIVSGARPLTSFTRSGNYWVVAGQTQEGERIGACQPAYPRCTYPEDLYINDQVMRHVASLAEVGPGKWFFDYGNDRIYFYDDPTNKRVETSVTRVAFQGSAPNVTISGLIIERFANPAQNGAIQGYSSSAWTVQDNEIRFNHGIGLGIGTRMKALRNKVHHNGELGVGGNGDDVLVEGNEIAYNNSLGYNPMWEAGGTKFVKTRRLMVRGNFVHHNDGPGLWTDIDNIYTVYEGNLVEDNTQMGIYHEISYDAIIRNNTVRRNGFGHAPWLWGAGICISASSNVEVHGNTVENNADGIAGIQQDRGTGAYGPWLVQNLSVHDNVVRMTGDGQNGIVQDYGDNAVFTSRNNRWANNTYYLGPNANYFSWLNNGANETQWRSYGHDTTGTFIR